MLQKLLTFMLIVAFSGAAIGCFRKSPPENYAILSAKMNEKEQSGKFFEFELDRPLPKDTYFFKIKFNTKEGDEIEEQGILTSRVHFFKEGPKYRMNVFGYFVSRHSTTARKEAVDKNLNPGHIEKVSIKLASDCYSGGFDEKCQFVEKLFVNL